MYPSRANSRKLMVALNVIVPDKLSMHCGIRVLSEKLSCVCV